MRQTIELTRVKARIKALADKTVSNGCTEAEAIALERETHPRLTGASLRSASKCFQQGMAARIADRLNEMHRERDASVAAQRSTGTALILVKHQVVEEAFRQTEVRLVSAGRLNHARWNGAFRHGLVAGNRVNLNRPVGDTARSLLS